MSGAMGMSANSEEIPDKGKLNLADIKRDIETFYKSFEKNFKRYRDYMILTFKSGLSDADKDNLQIIGKLTN